MAMEEMDFKLLDKVQTADEDWLTIGFMDNKYRKTISKKTAHSMFTKGQIIRKAQDIKGKIVYVNFGSLTSFELRELLHR